MAEFLLVVVVVMGIVAWQDGRKSIPSEPTSEQAIICCATVPENTCSIGKKGRVR